MKISNKDLATFYNITHATLLNYKKHKDIGYKRRYQALRDFYIKYSAYICVDNKQIFLGTSSNSIECAKAYDKYITDNNLEHTKNFN